MVERKKSVWTIAYPQHAHAEQSIVRIFEIGVCVMERTREGIFSAAGWRRYEREKLTVFFTVSFYWLVSCSSSICRSFNLSSVRSSNLC